MKQKPKYADQNRVSRTLRNWVENSRLMRNCKREIQVLLIISWWIICVRVILIFGYTFWLHGPLPLLMHLAIALGSICAIKFLFVRLIYGSWVYEPASEKNEATQRGSTAVETKK